MTKFIVPLFIAITCLFACKKEKQKEDEKVYPNYSQLKVGNYWIYQRFEIDTFGRETALNQYDSCYIEKDMLINGKTYFKLVSPYVIPPTTESSYLRDSLHYIVNSSGQILFSSEDYTTIFYSGFITYDITDTLTDTICQILWKMETTPLTVSTPAGTYSTLNVKHTYLMYPNWAQAGNPRYLNHRYAKDIGMVQETLPFFASEPNYTEKRLVRYHLN